MSSLRSEHKLVAGLVYGFLVNVLEVVGGAVNQRVGGDVVDDPRQAAGFGGNRLNGGWLKNGRGISGQFQMMLNRPVRKLIRSG